MFLNAVQMVSKGFKGALHVLRWVLQGASGRFSRRFMSFLKISVGFLGSFTGMQVSSAEFSQSFEWVSRRFNVIHGVSERFRRVLVGSTGFKCVSQGFKDGFEGILRQFMALQGVSEGFEGVLGGFIGSQVSFTVLLQDYRCLSRRFVSRLFRNCRRDLRGLLREFQGKGYVIKSVSRRFHAFQEVSKGLHRTTQEHRSFRGISYAFNAFYGSFTRFQKAIRTLQIVYACRSDELHWTRLFLKTFNWDYFIY